MSDVRPAAVAGMFYPEERTALSAEVEAYLAMAGTTDAYRRGGDAAQTGTGIPKAIIAPHAGYIYSGAIAGSAYARLASARETIRRVVLFGPAHRVPVRGLALPTAGVFATPLGNVEIDHEAATLAATRPQVSRSAAAHALEHSLEVQLPFLQTVLRDFRIVPFAVGDASPEEVSEIIDLLWGGQETLIVVSSDLSHYHRYADASALDRETAKIVLSLSATLDHDGACGATPINGLILSAKRRGLLRRRS